MSCDVVCRVMSRVLCLVCRPAVGLFGRRGRLCARPPPGDLHAHNRWCARKKKAEAEQAVNHSPRGLLEMAERWQRAEKDRGSFPFLSILILLSLFAPSSSESQLYKNPFPRQHRQNKHPTVRILYHIPYTIYHIPWRRPRRIQAVTQRTTRRPSRGPSARLPRRRPLCRRRLSSTRSR